MRAGLASLVLLLSLVLAEGASGQQVQLQAPEGPFYVGEPIILTVVAEGFEAEPEPAARFEPAQGGRLDLVRVDPNVSSSISIVNGRVTQSREVQFSFRFRFLAAKPGRATIPPIHVSQGGVTRRTRRLSFDVGTVPTSDRLAVDVVLPEGALFVGQRVPVLVEFRLEDALQKNLTNYTLQVPLFDQAERFRFLDREDPEARTDVEIETAAGSLRLKGRTSQRSEGGRRFLVVTVARTLVPLEAGRLELPPASLVVEEGTRFARDFFGSRRPTRMRRLRAVSASRPLEVRDLPSKGRPASFAGAVGRGFSLEVAADRTVVQVGEPITLSFALRGDGNLETAGLPPLDSPGLLPQHRFRVPEGDVPGVTESGVKRFEAAVRVLDEDVREIPGLEYSWFDPDAGRFETVRSRPIALSVRPARVVGAAEVFRDTGPEEPGATARDRELPAAAEPAASFALTGADLAIERDTERLLRRAAGTGPWLEGGLYGLSCVAVGLALFDRRRRQRPAELTRRRALLQEAAARLREARGLEPVAAAGEIARGLRAAAAECAELRGAELDAVLQACDTLSYAPSGASGAEDIGALAARGLALIEAAEAAK